MGRRTYDEMTVAEIAGAAGVSVGGFYARFPGKDALLQYLNVQVIDGLLEHARAELSPEATADLDARELISRFVTMVVRTFRQHRPLLQQVSLRSRTSTDPTFRLRIREANQAVHDLFREQLATRLGSATHPDPARAIDIGLTAVSGAMREYVLFAEHRPQFEPVEDDRLIAELTDMFCEYLRVPS